MEQNIHNTYSNPLDEVCPSVPSWWENKTFHSFYLPEPHHDEIIKSTNCNELLPNSIIVGEEELCDFRGQTWKKMPISINWQPGPFATDKNNFLRDHWHTWFHIQDHLVHIDYVSLHFGSCMCYGREYRVFYDGQDVGRGGGYLGFMMAVFGALRNLPLVVLVDRNLIYLHFVLQRWGTGIRHGEIKPEGTMSIWQIA